jgi:hypothetical protein
MFRFYTNAVSQASRKVTSGIFIIGLVLIGFGVVILALPEIFAFLAAVIFFIAGLGCAVTAVKIFWTMRKINKISSDENHRENVQIHIEENYYDE